MNCIIIDDEPLAREGLSILISNFNNLNLIASFSNVIEADTFLNKNQIDLIFLDINMPGISGIEYLKNKTNRPLVILSTAYTDYALESYDLDVIDYLVKPVRIERFQKAISKCQIIYDKSKPREIETSKNESDFLFIRSDRKYIKLIISQISHIESLKDYVLIYYNDNKYPVPMNLSTILKKLNPDIFVRVNRFNIININQIESFEADLINIKKSQISIGEKYKNDFYKLMLDDKLIKRD